RVAAAPINMECRVVQIIPIGNGPSNLVIGEIVQLHFRDDVYDPATGRLDMHRLRPVGRLAGQLYPPLPDIFEMKRPSANYRGCPFLDSSLYPELDVDPRNAPTLGASPEVAPQTTRLEEINREQKGTRLLPVPRCWTFGRSSQRSESAGRP